MREKHFPGNIHLACWDVHLDAFVAKTRLFEAAFSGCPWEGQGYTALLALPRRPPAAGPMEKLRPEMPAACKRSAQ